MAWYLLSCSEKEEVNRKTNNIKVTRESPSHTSRFAGFSALASGAGIARPGRSRILTLLAPSTALAFPLRPLCLRRKIDN